MVFIFIEISCENIKFDILFVGNSFEYIVDNGIFFEDIISVEKMFVNILEDIIFVEDLSNNIFDYIIIFVEFSVDNILYIEDCSENKVEFRDFIGTSLK